MPAQTVIRLRSGTAAQWASVNPILAAGEMGVESDTRKFKFGNGTAQWNSIAYASSGGAGGGGFFVAETAPVGANIGDIWYCTADTGELGGKSFIRYDGYWVEINPGVLGPKGDTGATGATGATGPANTLTVGSVTTLAAGSLATITITGTAPNQTVNFGIPQGVQGEQSVVAADAPITYNPTTQTVGINQSGLSITKSQVSDFAHTHVKADITDFAHTHVINDVTGLQTALDGKAATVHTHNMGQIITTVTDRASAYTIVAADENTFIRSTSATAVTMTIANVLNVGESIQFIQFGAGQITFAAGAGVTLRSVDSKLKTNKQYSVAAVTCIASGEYLVTGDLAA